MANVFINYYIPGLNDFEFVLCHSRNEGNRCKYAEISLVQWGMNKQIYPNPSPSSKKL